MELPGALFKPKLKKQKESPPEKAPIFSYISGN